VAGEHLWAWRNNAAAKDATPGMKERSFAWMGKQRVGQRVADLTPEELRSIQKHRGVFCPPTTKGTCTAG